jgi:hypothetical protein
MRPASSRLVILLGWLATAAGATVGIVTTGPTGAQLPASGLRGRRSSAAASEAAYTDDRVPHLPGRYTAVFDVRSLGATGFNCSVVGYNITTGDNWGGVQGSLGCGGGCGLISFRFEPEICVGTSGSEAAAQYFMSGGMSPLTLFEYDPTNDRPTPDALCCSQSSA